MTALGSFLADRVDTSLTTALERKADIIGAGFRVLRSERQLSPKTVVRSHWNRDIRRAANGQKRSFNVVKWGAVWPFGTQFLARLGNTPEK